MIFLDGFLKYSFLPVALMALAGIVLLIMRLAKKRREQPVFIAIAIFALLMALWRIPVVITPRYMAVLSVPSIIFSVYFLRRLHAMACKSEYRYYWYTGIRIFLFFLVVICICKALRPPRKKNFLRAIPQIIINDIKNTEGQYPLTLIIGPSGGVLDEIPGETINILRNRDFQESDLNWEGLDVRLKELNIELQHLAHRNIYIIIKEPSASTFERDFETRYHKSLVLRYEDSMNGDSEVHRLYELDILSNQIWQSPGELLQFFKRENVLANGDFCAWNQEYLDSQPVLSLTERGFVLQTATSVGWPLGWYVNTWAGWLEKALPAGISRESTQNGLCWMEMYANTTISLWNQAEIPGNVRYCLLLDIAGDTSSVLQTFFLNKGHIIKEFIHVPRERILLLKNIATDDGADWFNFAIYLGSGRVMLYGIYLVPQKKIDLYRQSKQSI